MSSMRLRRRSAPPGTSPRVSATSCMGTGRSGLAAGKLDDSQTVAETVQRAAGWLKTDSARGAALRCRGLVRDDPHILQQALDACRSAPRPLERALAAEETGAALARIVKPAEAAANLGGALKIYEQLGAIGYAARVEAQLRDLGV